MKWQTLTAAVGSILVVVLISYVALTATGESTPDAGGTYVEGMTGSPTSINPILAFSDSDNDLVHLIFSGLTKVGPRGDVLPDLAEKWEISEDSHVYKFFLRQDVMWHDGTRLTANDVIFTVKAIQDPQFPGSPYLAEVWKNAVVEKVDDFTVKFTLKDAYAPFLGYTTIGILPAASFLGMPIKEMSEAPFRGSPIGTGPFKLTELTVEYAMLEMNQSYYGGKLPFLSKIKFRFFPDYKTALTSLRQKGIQGLPIEAMEDVPRLRENKELSVYEAPRSGYTLVFLNLKSPLFKDKAVRQAMMYALDREKLIEVAAGGLGMVAHSPVIPNTWAYKEGVKQYGYDPVQAKTMLDTAGWKLGSDGWRTKDGTRLSFSLLTNDEKTRVRSAEEIARQLKNVGIEARVSASGYTGLIQNFLIPRQFEALLYGLETGGDPDSYSSWHSSQIKADGFNFAGFANRKADELLEQARQTADKDKRISLYGEFQDLFVEEVPAILLYHPTYVYAMDSMVKGPELGVIFDSDSRFFNVVDWYVRTKRTMFMTK